MVSQRRPADPWFFLIISLILLGLIFSGFWNSFYLRAFVEPPKIHADAYFTPMLYVHGSVLTVWFLLLFTQSLLIQAGNVAMHRRLGIVGMVLAVALVFSVIPAMFDFVPRIARAGISRDVALKFGAPLFWFDVFNLIGFVVLVGWAWLKRRDGAFHKRLMILASISMMVPALFRAAQTLLPGIPPMPFSLLIVVALIVSVYVWDVARFRRPHKATILATSVIGVTYTAGFWVGSLPAAIDLADKIF
jgi:uncharacterized membrane protein YozB (DUF420 family)